MSTKDRFLEYIKAYNAKDVRAMLTFFDERCVFENVSGGKVTVRTEGKAELEDLARRSAQAFATREQKVVSLIEVQGRIAAEIVHAAEDQALFPMIPARWLTPDFRASPKRVRYAGRVSTT